MEEIVSKDKLKLQDILDEIENLKNYNRELLDNTKGEKLENYIGNLDRSIEKLREKVNITIDKK